MLFWLAHYLMHYYPAFRVFQYVTFRSIFGSLTALCLVLFLMPAFIRYLTVLKVGQSVRTDGPQSHLKKSGTPTMGGGLILIAIAISVLLWGDLQNRFLWITLFVMITTGMIGWVDDYRKVKLKNSKGLPGRWKFFWQAVIALIAALFLYYSATLHAETALYIPFLKHVAFDLGFFFVVITFLMIVGTSNAVNLTDGLDGLAIMPTIMVAGGLAVFAYLTGNFKFAEYLVIPDIPGAGEMAVYCSAMIGASLGFLWYNTYPAQVFMGDVGALALGATLGTIAVIVRQEIVFLIMSGIFVLETFSVMLQVASFKLTGKRVFKMAPIHHHFELKGWAEPKVIVRFWIITLILVLLGLATLKLR